MKISSDVFDAFLKCPTKCWLRAVGETGSGNPCAERMKSQTASYRSSQTEQLVSETRANELAVSPVLEEFKAGRWRVATGVVGNVQTNSCILESGIHAVVRVPGRRRSPQFVPIRFIFTNKLGKEDK